MHCEAWLHTSLSRINQQLPATLLQACDRQPVVELIYIRTVKTASRFNYTTDLSVRAT